MNEIVSRFSGVIGKKRPCFPMVRVYGDIWVLTCIEVEFIDDGKKNFDLGGVSVATRRW